MKFIIKNDMRKNNHVSMFGNIVTINHKNKPVEFTKKTGILPELYETITEIEFSYQNTCLDLHGIEKLVNLEKITMMGALADMTSLANCKKLKEIHIVDSCMIDDLEALNNHPTLEILNLHGFLTNYDKTYVETALTPMFSNLKTLVWDFKYHANYPKHVHNEY